jgi:hypothetical protein
MSVGAVVEETTQPAALPSLEERGGEIARSPTLRTGTNSGFVAPSRFDH